MKNCLKLITIMVAPPSSPRRSGRGCMDGAEITPRSKTGLLRRWPQEGPKMLWTVPMGAGVGRSRQPGNYRRTRRDG